MLIRKFFSASKIGQNDSFLWAIQQSNGDLSGLLVSNSKAVPGVDPSWERAKPSNSKSRFLRVNLLIVVRHQ